MPAKDELPSTLRRSPGETAGGVDANASKEHLMELARAADIPGRSTMTKDELVRALEETNRRETALRRTG